MFLTSIFRTIKALAFGAGERRCLSQAHLLESAQKESWAAVEGRSVTARAVMDEALKVGQHDRVSHSLVNKGQKVRRCVV